MGTASCGIYEALWLARLHQRGARALYVHVPFCVRKCAYCDFASWATDAQDPLMERYVEVLERLLWQAADAGLLTSCETAYVGGGTPSYLGNRLAGLLASVLGAAPGLTELSCEANPDSLSEELACKLAQAGCTRLSLGVQSLDDEELRLLGRVHTAAQAQEGLRAAVACGLDVSCDLMCALPGQTDESWVRTLEQALACGVGHVSVYPLQIEEGTPFDVRYGDEYQPWHEDGVQAARMVQAAQFLEAVGFARYEVASYAREGKACRHNEAYWTAQSYLGLGTSASSMLAKEGYEQLRTLAPQLPKAGEHAARIRLTCTDRPSVFVQARALTDLHFDLEFLTAEQAAAEDLMLGMRRTQGVDPGLLDHAFRVLGRAEVDEALAWCAERGLTQYVGQRWVPTSKGWLLGNELYGRLWALAPGEVASASCP